MASLVGAVLAGQLLTSCATVQTMAGAVGVPRPDGDRRTEELAAALQASTPPSVLSRVEPVADGSVVPTTPTGAAGPAGPAQAVGQPAAVSSTAPAAPAPSTTGNLGAIGRVDPDSPCTVGPVPASLGLDPFYAKACLVGGVPVVSSAVVHDAALVEAARIVAGMLSGRPDLWAALADGPFRLGVIGVDERAIDLPEYRDLPSSFPDTDWDAARAYGATPRRPLAAVPEENLLCSAADTYPGQSVLPHELAHSVLDMVLAPRDPGIERRLVALYDRAHGVDAYRNTYALTNVDEYWAEGVQDFFDASRAAYGPAGGGDGYDGPIASREKLRQEDPGLYDLVATVFTEVAWSPTCPR